MGLDHATYLDDAAKTDADNRADATGAPHIVKRAPRIAVVGAGIAGATAAYALTRRGLKITLIDRRRYAAMETSYANGGQLSASNAETWTHPSTILKGLKWMLRKDAPLLLNPTPSFAKYAWMVRFLANMPSYRSNTIATARLAIAARDVMTAWAEEEGINYDRVERGILHFYQTEDGLAHARRVNEMLVAAGLARREISTSEISEIEPTLSGAFSGGFYTPSDATGDIHKFARGVADAAARRGAELRFDTEIDTLARRGDGKVEILEADGTIRDYDGVVVAAGADSARIARKLGERAPVYPIKGYSITVGLDDTASRAGAPWTSLLDDETKIVASRLGDNRYRVAGTAEICGWNKDIRADRIRPLVNWVRDRLPGVSTESVTPWAGLRPMTPSMMPIVGAGRQSGVFFHTGHGHLGWTLSAATAEQLADAVVAAELV